MKMIKVTKRLFAFVFTATLILTMALGAGTVFAEDGETPQADGSVCAHEHDDSCGYIEGADCVHECGAECTDSCVHIAHGEDCGYIEAAPCTHEHDVDCGGMVLEQESEDETTLTELNPTEPAPTAPTSEKTISEDMLTAISAMASGGFSPLSITDSGNCGAQGNNVTYTFEDTTGTLTISGTGGIADYSTDTAPWASYRADILNVVIDSGVNSISGRLFSGFTNLASITLPDSVQGISDHAFFACASLTSITIPKGVTSIDAYAFNSCIRLQSVTFEGMTPPTIGSNAFDGVSDSGTVTFPEGATGYDQTWLSGITGIANWTLQSNDTTAPTLTTTGMENRLNETEATASFDSTEEGTYYYQLNGATPTAADLVAAGTNATVMTFNQTISLSGLAAGAHTLYVAAKDAAGNVSNLLTIIIPAYVPMAPVFAMESGDQSITEGGNAFFQAAAIGRPTPTHRWQVDTGTGFVDIADGGVYSGATTSGLTLTGVPASFDGYVYRCIASNGILPDATSTLKALSVTSRALTVASPTFPTITVGDARPVAQAIIIKNTSNDVATISGVTVSPTDVFDIGGSGASVAAGGSIDTWTVRPKDGLAVGTHEATITVTYDGTASTTATAKVSIAVNAKSNIVYTATGTGTHTSGDYVITSDGEFSKFTGVTKDGTALTDGTHFTAAEGSTIVTIKADYMQSLPAGNHTFTLLFTDGQAAHTVNVVKAKVTQETPTDTTNTDTATRSTSPKTGDESGLSLYIALCMTAGVCIYGAVLYMRRKRDQE